MGIDRVLEESGKYQVEPYKKTGSLPVTHVPFTGTPRKHDHDPGKILLIPDPFSTGTFYYEFFLSDVEYIEKLSSMVNLSGDTLPMVRVWVRKGSLALRSTPFVVEDTLSRLENKTPETRSLPPAREV